MNTTTVGALITAAAEELEVIDSGGSLTTAEQSSALDRLNRFIDRSSADRAVMFAERRDLLTLVAGTQSYTIGKDPSGVATAAFDVPRPVKLDRANLLITSDTRRTIHVIDFREWAGIRYQNVSGPPQKVYLDNAFATGFATLYFYNIPDQNYQFELYSWQQNAAVASTAARIDYPPAYADYWLYGLVIRMASMFGRQPTQLHIDLFNDAKAVISSLNAVSPEMRLDPTLLADRGGLYNWKDGQIED